MGSLKVTINGIIR